MTENAFDCDDKGLGPMLQRLFDEGNDEVVVRHPTEGDIIVTRDDFKKHLADLEKAVNMSPADRIEETARLKNIKNQKQIRFRTDMVNAPVHTVDIEDDENFGKDIEGVQMDIEGMVFLPVAQYLKGIEPKEHELGCFMSEYDENRSPIRILQNTAGVGDAAN